MDLEAARDEVEKAIGRKVSDNDLASYLMYPKVFREYADHHRAYGDVSLIPTSVFFNGLRDGEEIAVDIDPGKTLVIGLQGHTATDEDGHDRCSSS